MLRRSSCSLFHAAQTATGTRYFSPYGASGAQWIGNPPVMVSPPDTPTENKKEENTNQSPATQPPTTTETPSISSRP